MWISNPRLELYDRLTVREYRELKRCMHGELELYYCNSLYDKLCDYYRAEMPYGTAKARTGDPDCWIMDRVERDMCFDHSIFQYALIHYVRKIYFKMREVIM